MRKAMREALDSFEDKYLIIWEYVDGKAEVANKIYKTKSSAEGAIKALFTRNIDANHLRGHVVNMDKKLLSTHFRPVDSHIKAINYELSMLESRIGFEEYCQKSDPDHNTYLLDFHRMQETAYIKQIQIYSK